MMQTESTADGERCSSCQHSVDVRGMQEVVCLAHLAVFDPVSDSVCSEFESKRKSFPASASQ